MEAIFGSDVLTEVEVCVTSFLKCLNIQGVKIVTT